MLARAVLVAVASFVVLVILGRPLRRWLSLPGDDWLETIAFEPALGAAALGLIVSLGLLLRLSNGVLLGLIGAALLPGLLTGWRELPKRGEPRRFAWLFAVFLLFLAAQLAFVFHPGPPVDAGRQMARSGDLPVDCLIPFEVSRFILERIDPSRVMLLGDWRLTDRTPLMGLVVAGLRLLLGASSYETFIGMGAVLNGLFFFPAALLARRLAGARAVAVLSLLILFNGFIGVNTWFTWPKLMATAYVLLAHHLLTDRRSPMLAGMLAALAWLSHPLVVFYLPVLAWLAGRPALKAADRLLVAARFCGATLLGYAPWLLYTRLFSTDSGRLVKWHLFGRIAADDLSVREAARRYITEHTLSELLHIRLMNLLRPWSPLRLVEAVRAVGSGDWGRAAAELWRHAFQRFPGALNLAFLAAVAGVALRHRVAPGLEERRVLVLGLGGYLTAGLLLGTVDGTYSHQWAYPAVLAALCAMAAVLARVKNSRLLVLLGPGVALHGLISWRLLRRAGGPLGAEVALYIAATGMAAACAWHLLRATSPVADETR